MDELDALSSFDSVIDSFDDADGNPAEVIQPKSGSVAQTQLEGLFKPHNTTTNNSKGIPAKLSSTDSTGESVITEVQARLESRHSEINDNGQQPVEDNRGSSRPHTAAGNHASEQ